MHDDRDSSPEVTSQSPAFSASESLKVETDTWQNAKGDIDRQHDWTIVHSFFVLMGGYEVVVDPDLNRNFFPKSTSLDVGREALRLSASSFKLLANRFPYLIPDQPQEKIDDKSKGDGVAKSIICLQGQRLSLIYPFHQVGSILTSYKPCGSVPSALLVCRKDLALAY